jgi:hypothetical protein
VAMSQLCKIKPILIQKTAKSWQKIHPTCSTIVENPLQINSFYAKQSQFPKSQMNVNLYNTTDYGNKSNWTLGKNKPNSKPNKANFRKAKMSASVFATKDYEEKMRIRAMKKQSQNKPNSNPIKANFKRDDGFSAYYTIKIATRFRYR